MENKKVRRFIETITVSRELSHCVIDGLSTRYEIDIIDCERDPRISNVQPFDPMKEKVELKVYEVIRRN